MIPDIITATEYESMSSLRELSVIYATIQQQDDCVMALDLRSSTTPINVLKGPVENTSDK